MATPADTLHLNKSLREILLLLNRRRALILGIVLAMTLGGALFIMHITPQYIAEATVMVESRKTDVVDAQPVVSPLTADVASIRSEIDVLHSRQLASKVVDKLNLDGNPTFIYDLTPPNIGGDTKTSAMIKHLPTWLQYPAYTVAGGLHLLPLSPEQGTVIDQSAAFHSLVVTKLLQHLTVSSDGRSNTIRIAYESPAPKLAADITNTFVDLYLTDQLDSKLEETKRASDWLGQQIIEMKGVVEQKEQAVQAYQAAHGLTTKDTQGTTVTSQQLSEVNTALITASADLAAKEARLSSFQASTKKGGEFSSAPEVLQSALIQQLRGKESEVESHRAELMQQFGDKMPSVQEANSQLANIRTTIQSEITKIVNVLAQDRDAARIKVQELQKSLALLQTQAEKNDSASVGLRELQRSAQAQRMTYETLLARQPEIIEESGLQHADVRIIARADTPLRPSFPSKPLFVIMAFGGSLLVSVSMAMMLERLDNKFRSAEQIQEETGIPAIGMLPMIANANANHVLVSPRSSFSEAIRGIESTLRYTNVDKAPKVVLITSSVPEEGKSLLAVSFARSAALSTMTMRVLLVDCDFRKPSVLRALGGNKDKTLVDALAVHAADPHSDAFIDIINQDKDSGLDFIVARPNNAPNPPAIFASNGFAAFLNSAKQEYDLIVLDSPPVMAAADAAVLAKVSDATMFVVRWGETPQPVVRNALRQLANNKIVPNGIILTRVNLRKHARYGMGDQAHYYGVHGSTYAVEAKATR